MSDNARAVALDRAWNILTSKFDDYFTSLPDASRKTFQKAISEWQDFYFGSETWPADKLAYWETVLAKAAQMLTAAIPANAKIDAPSDNSKKVAASKVDPIFAIFGKRDIGSLVDFKPPAWWWWALGALPALAILYLTRQGRRL